jgi:hypothetical protein
LQKKDKMSETKLEKKFFSKDGRFYFPFPDSIVYFAYPLPRIDLLQNTLLQNTLLQIDLKKLYLEFSKQYGAGVVNRMKNDDKIFLILYPLLTNNSNQKQEEKEFYKKIGYLQYLVQTGEYRQELDIFPRIHLGSPHMFYRWLATNNDGDNNTLFEFTREEPIYPLFLLESIESIDQRNLVPLYDDMGTMFINVTVNHSIPSSSSLPSYSPERGGGIYCGDFQSNWQKAYKYGKAGTFSKCLHLYHEQRGPAAPLNPRFLSSVVKRGYPERSYRERGYPERSYRERGYPERSYRERGYQERGYRERGYPERGDQERSYPERGDQERSGQESGYLERSQGEGNYREGNLGRIDRKEENGKEDKRGEEIAKREGRRGQKRRSEEKEDEQQYQEHHQEQEQEKVDEKKEQGQILNSIYLETEAMDLTRDRMQQEIDAAQKKYTDSQKQLLLLQTNPFIRPGGR